MGMTLTFNRLSVEKLRAMESDFALVEALVENEDPETSLFIDKSWDGVHYLLTGRRFDGTTRLAECILGGEILGGEENAEAFVVGYGPPMYLLPAEVKIIAQALSDINMKEVENRCVPATFAELDIYAFNATNASSNADDEFEYFMSHLKEVIKFYQVAASNKEVVVKLMT